MLKIFLLLLLALVLALVVSALYRARKAHKETDAILGLESVLRPSRSRAALSAARQLLGFAHFFTSITAALTLTLVALVIALVFVYERSEHTLDTNVSPVLQLLQERLTPSDLQTERHHQLLASLDAIRQHAASPPGFLQTTAFANSLTVFLLLLVGLILFWVCLALPINSAFAKRTVAAIALFAPLGLSLLPTVKGTLLEKLTDSLFRFDIAIAKESSPRTQIDPTLRPAADTALECDPDWVVASFRSGRSDALESRTTETEGKRVATSLGARRQGRQLAALLFIGSADIQPLSALTVRTFGSNTGLAQSRALNVKHIVESHLPQPLPTALVLTAGPASTVELANQSSSEKVTLMARDRSVRICVLWVQ